MSLNIAFFIIALWNTCIIRETSGQNYPARNGRHLRNENIPFRYTPRSIYDSRIYSGSYETNARPKPLGYNSQKDQNSGNGILKSPKPIPNFRITVGISNKNSSVFNIGSWKILNGKKDNHLHQRGENSDERKCNPFSGERCLRNINRRKVQNLRNNANTGFIHDTDFGIKETRRTENISTILNVNIHQTLNDNKRSSVSREENKLFAKLGPNSCACYWRQEECGCKCEGTLNYDDFQDVSRSFFPCHNFTFTMADGEFYALPPNFFSKIKSVQDFNLFITNSTFEYMCDPTPLTSPFKGVIFESSAQIKLTNVKVRRGWNWKPFEQLKSSSGAQVNVTLENCQLRRLTSDFANLAGGHVDIIDINNSDLEMVGSNAFGTFENMTHFRVPRNKIQHLRRTDFPELLLNLEELDLRNNELSYLDNDLFTNMPSLKEIVLSGNPISVLPEATFQAVISKAELVGISDISLTCDCRLQWLKDSVKNDNITEKNMKGAVCRRPPYLRGMPFDLLSKEHLICP